MDYRIPMETAALIENVALVVIVLVFLLVIFLLARRVMSALRRMSARRAHHLELEEMHKRWARIEGLLRAPDADTDRLAVIEADNLLDYVLKAMHLPGDNLSRRLGFATNKYYELKRVRWAHGLRNKLVHEQDYRLSRKQAYAAVKEFERALKVLGAL